MSSPAEHTRAAERCAECGARVRPDDRWCTLCHTPVAVLAPAADRGPLPPEPAGAVDDGPVDDGADRDPDRDADADPDPDADPDRDAAARVAAEAAERLLAELRAGEAHRLPPRLAAIRPRTKAAEALLACSGGLLMVGLLFGALYVVGRFL